MAVPAPYALTMISAVRIRNKHPEWYINNKNTVKGGNALRIMAMIIMLAIAFFCTLGQGIGSWISFAVYDGSRCMHLVMDGPHSLETCQSNH